MKIKKILVANRGEIALRVLKTAKEMDIKVVTIFAEDDKNLPHALFSDEAYSLGSGALSDTYLNKEKIIDAYKLSVKDLVLGKYILVQFGKKKYFVITVK